VTASAPFTANPLYCHQDTNFLTQVKGYAAYTLPADVQIAATFQSIFTQALAANVTYTSAQVAASLGRALSTTTNTTVNVIPPGTVYGDRLNQLDLRLGKNFTVQRYKLNASVDFYNLLNSDAVLNENSSFTVWRRPLSLVKPRFLKFSAQLNF
jgi:hypothetical protein